MKRKRRRSEVAQLLLEMFILGFFDWLFVVDVGCHCFDNGIMCEKYCQCEDDCWNRNTGCRCVGQSLTNIKRIRFHCVPSLSDLIIVSCMQLLFSRSM